MMNWKSIRPGLVLVLILPALLGACGKSTRDQLIGQWKSETEVPAGDNQDHEIANEVPLMELAFFEDSSCTFRMNARVMFVGQIPTLPCSWILSGDDLLKLDIELPDRSRIVESYTVRIDNHRLELLESNGSSTVLNKVSGGG